MRGKRASNGRYSGDFDGVLTGFTRMNMGFHLGFGIVSVINVYM